MKKVFEDYFKWERDARHSIHEVVGYTGLMLHDGIDGIISDMNPSQLEEHILRKTNIRVSVEKPPSQIEFA